MKVIEHDHTILTIKKTQSNSQRPERISLALISNLFFQKVYHSNSPSSVNLNEFYAYVQLKSNEDYIFYSKPKPDDS